MDCKQFYRDLKSKGGELRSEELTKARQSRAHKALEEDERLEVAEYFGVRREAAPSYVGVTRPIGIYEMASSSYPSLRLSLSMVEVPLLRVPSDSRGVYRLSGKGFALIVAQAVFASTGAFLARLRVSGGHGVVGLVCNLLLPKGRRDIAFDEVTAR